VLRFLRERSGNFVVTRARVVDFAGGWVVVVSPRFCAVLVGASVSAEWGLYVFTVDIYRDGGVRVPRVDMPWLLYRCRAVPGPKPY
jgi:hypothetical protein